MVGCFTSPPLKMLLVALLLLVTPFLASGCRRASDVPTVLTSPEDWPNAVRDLRNSLTATTPSLRMDGHLLSGKPGPNSIGEAVFRVHNASVETFEQLKSTLQLVPVAPEDDLAKWGDFVVKNSSGQWWAANDQDGTELYASQNLLEGEEGDLYVVARETSSGTVYVCYHFNF